DLLHELRADQPRDAAASRAGDKNAECGMGNGELFLDAFEELQDLLRLLGLVALIILPEDSIFYRIDHNRLHRRRSDVEADVELFLMLIQRVLARALKVEGKQKGQ